MKGERSLKSPKQEKVVTCPKIEAVQWTAFVCILRVEYTRLASELDVESDKKIKIQDNSPCGLRETQV